MIDRISYRGLTLDGPYIVRSVEGLAGSSARVGGDTDQPRGDGELPGVHFLDARHITLTVRTVGLEHVSALVSAFRVSRRDALPLSWEEFGSERRCFARPIESSAGWDLGLGPVADDFTVALKASDPRIYGRRRVVLLNPYGVVSAGLDYPVDYPKVYGADSRIEAVARNSGDSDAHPTIRVRGPDVGTLDGFEVHNVTNGARLQVDTPVGAGQTLTVRMREWVTADPNRLVVELDGASRYGDWVTRPDLLWLSPGDNVLRLNVPSGEEPSGADLAYRDTFAGTVQGE